MVFKRREKRSWSEFVWPRKGWARAFHYVRHRVSRLPDSPEKIARGVFAGVFVTFSPFFGLHFVLSVLLSLIIRGNVVAGLLATFIGNPLTFVFIAALSLNLGHLVLGLPQPTAQDQSTFHLTLDSMSSLYHNLLAPFTGETADWAHLQAFYHDIFFPYMVGGVVGGFVVGVICYYLTLPVIRAYRKSRQKLLAARWQKIKQKAAIEADEIEADEPGDSA